MDSYIMRNKFQDMLITPRKDFWNNICNFIFQHKAYLSHPNDFEFIFHSMIRKLFLSDCDDPQLAFRIINVYHHWIQIGSVIYNKYPLEEWKLDCLLEPLDYKNKYKLYDMEDGNKFLSAIADADLDFTKVLVKYGKISENIRFDIFNMGTGKSYLEKFLYCMRSRMFHHAISFYDCSRQASDVVFTMVRTKGKIGNYQRGSLRIFIITRIFNNLMRKILENTQDRREYSSTVVNNHIDCLGLYFTATNEPFIPQDEIKDLLMLLFANEDNCEEVVEKLLNIYRGMFHPKSIRVYEPRTLKHQSRFAARSYLSYRNVSLPRLIRQQNVPPCIKEFLLGAPEFRS